MFHWVAMFTQVLLFAFITNYELNVANNFVIAIANNPDTVLCKSYEYDDPDPGDGTPRYSVTYGPIFYETAADCAALKAYGYETYCELERTGTSWLSQNAPNVADSPLCQPTISAKSSGENALSIITLMGAAIPLQILVFNQLAIYCKARGYFAEKELQGVENATVPKDGSDHGSDHAL